MYILFLVALVYVTIWYLISVFKKRADIMDIAWGLGFIILSIAWEMLGGPLSWIFLGLLILHQGRLSAYIAWRGKGKPEDKRYADWRKEWGKTFWWRSYLQVFVLQGAILSVVLGSLIVFAMQPPLWMLCLGITLWGYGMIYEVGGDWQLLLFKADAANKGKILSSGLWSRTRHPNYWGECCIWWAYWLVLGASPIGLIAPILMTFLLLKVSGVAMTESKMNRSKSYEDYKKSVPAFAPTKHFF